MGVRAGWLAGVAAVLAAGGFGLGAEPAADPLARDVHALAGKIDQHIARRWAEARVEPAEPADDAEFLRRVYLDVAGRIPSVAEARAFLKDPRPDRRSRLVEQLLSGPRYSTHFTNVLRALLIPEANNNFLVRLQQRGFEEWLKRQLAKNAGYDELARALLTAPVGGQGLAGLGGGDAPSALAFYSAKEFRPENLAAGAARVFLGVSVECAQCHDHPFADWKREQFWSFAAFFAGIQSRQLMDVLIPAPEIPDRKELNIPGSERVVQARFLDGGQPEWKPQARTRDVLADWVASPANPYFARAVVNRTWAYLFGTGLVEPVDEMVGATSTASHPELLDLLAREFAEHRFDLKFLLRALTATRAYQLTSAGAAVADDPTLFARMPLRGLTAEQLFDSVALATGYRDSGSAGDDLRSLLVGGNRSARSEFLTRFANPSSRAVEAQTSILQALSLMNGRVIADATSLTRSETLAAVVDAPFLTTPQRLETLYLASLSRPPVPRELDRAVRFIDSAVQKAGPDQADAAYRAALADVFWALLNSSEFILNH
jgi:hypothetical protein